MDKFSVLKPTAMICGSNRSIYCLNVPLQIYPANSRFWYISSRRLFQQFHLNLKEKAPDLYEVVSIETSGELDRSRLVLPLSLANFMRSPSLSSLEALSPKDLEDTNSGT